MCVSEAGREGERLKREQAEEKQRQKEREKHRNRNTDKERDKHRKRETQRKRQRQKQRERETERQRQKDETSLHGSEGVAPYHPLSTRPSGCNRQITDRDSKPGGLLHPCQTPDALVSHSLAIVHPR